MLAVGRSHVLFFFFWFPNVVSTHRSASAAKEESVSSRAENYQVPLWIDRVKLPECFWQPAALLGVDESGLGEMMRRVLVRLDPAQSSRVVKDVLLCGGSALLPGFLPRLAYELRQLRPTGAPIRVRLARDPQLDAWKGAASVCNTFVHRRQTPRMRDGRGSDASFGRGAPHFVSHPPFFFFTAACSCLYFLQHSLRQLVPHASRVGGAGNRLHQGERRVQSIHSNAA